MSGYVDWVNPEGKCLASSGSERQQAVLVRNSGLPPSKKVPSVKEGNMSEDNAAFDQSRDEGNGDPVRKITGRS